jgi:hypothetical protein
LLHYLCNLSILQSFCIVTSRWCSSCIEHQGCDICRLRPRPAVSWILATFSGSIFTQLPPGGVCGGAIAFGGRNGSHARRFGPLVSVTWSPMFAESRATAVNRRPVDEVASLSTCNQNKQPCADIKCCSVTCAGKSNGLYTLPIPATSIHAPSQPSQMSIEPNEQAGSHPMLPSNQPPFTGATAGTSKAPSSACNTICAYITRSIQRTTTTRQQTASSTLSKRSS